MADSILVKDYEGVFDPLQYMQTFYGDISSQTDLMPFLFQGLHSAFSEGDIHGQCVLDIGTGPSICSVISAAPYFQDIVLSDVSAVNRGYLENWVRGTGATHSLRNIFLYFLQLENSQASWQTRETEVRTKVKDVLKCDLLRRGPFADYSGPLFDAVTSSLCIEAAATDIASYREICTKVAYMLIPGGYLVLAGVLEQTFYRTCGEKFYSLYVTKDDVLAAWRDAGLSVESWSEQRGPPPEENPFSD